MLILKAMLTASILIVMLATSFLEERSDPNSLAAVYALMGATVLFIRLIPGEGRIHDGIDYLLALAGAFAAFWAGWFWLDFNNTDVAELAYVVFAVLLIAAVALLTQGLARFHSTFRRSRND